MQTTLKTVSPNKTTRSPRTNRERLRDVLADAPRHLFVPTTAWAIGADQWPYPIDRNTQPDQWWAAAHSDQAIALRADEGFDARSTMLPASTVLRLLDLLDVRDHHRILEIGTGTAWTTALLAHLVGERNLTTLEFDSQTAEVAKANLNNLGLAPRSHVVKTQVGYACASPLDRILVNFGVADIPYHWIAQCRPGGVIVLPWTPGPAHGNALRLTVINHAHATGSFHGPAETPLLPSAWPPASTDQATTSGTLLDPRELLHADQGAHLTIAHFAPGIGWHTIRGDSGHVFLRLFETDYPSGSWAICDYQPAAHEFTITQHGDRNLWDEVSDAYLRWCSWGKPTQCRFGLTIDEWHGQTLWLDHDDAILG